RALADEVRRRAGDFQARGVGPEQVVGICLERTAEMVATVLAVVTAGGGGLAPDPGAPAGRAGARLGRGRRGRGGGGGGDPAGGGEAGGWRGRGGRWARSTSVRGGRPAGWRGAGRRRIWPMCCSRRGRRAPRKGWR